VATVAALQFDDCLADRYFRDADSLLETGEPCIQFSSALGVGVQKQFPFSASAATPARTDICSKAHSRMMSSNGFAKVAGVVFRSEDGFQASCGTLHQPLADVD
jgi:hypothetical protein